MWETDQIGASAERFICLDEWGVRVRLVLVSVVLKGRCSLLTHNWTVLSNGLYVTNFRPDARRPTIVAINPI